MEDDTSCGGVELEGVDGDFDVNPSSLTSSAISNHSTAGLVAMTVCLGSTTETEMEGDAVFQESWLYILADDSAVDIIAVDITNEIAVKTVLPGKEYRDSSVGLNSA
jgi:hypothetical protein